MAKSAGIHESGTKASLWSLVTKWVRPKVAPQVTKLKAKDRTSVDSYWGDHTVNSTPFKTAEESEKYLEWRFSAYPLFREFVQLYGEHDGEVILDYGCGPGNDLTGFAINTGARKIIGIDISAKALNLARRRLALHGVSPERVELLQSADSLVRTPLAAASVDYVQSLGVLHHTSNPGALLDEFHRVLKPGGRASVMVYNYDSVYLHLFTAYERQVLQGAFRGLSAREAFSKNVDGVNCPIALCYRAEEFAPLCESAGFETEYVGGYFSRDELDSLARHGEAAMRDGRLADEHKEFIASLTPDADGLPKYNGYHAGVGGVFRLFKR